MKASNCSSYTTSADVHSIAHHSQIMGKSIGLITTTRITHATPAAMYAHTPQRFWEDDTQRNKHVSKALRDHCPDIALQMINNAKDFKVSLHEQGTIYMYRSEYNVPDHILHKLHTKRPQNR